MKKKIIVISLLTGIIIGIIFISYNISKNAETEVLKEYEGNQLYISNDIVSEINNYLAAIRNSINNYYKAVQSVNQNKFLNLNDLAEHINYPFIEAIKIYDKNMKLKSSTNPKFNFDNLTPDIFSDIQNKDKIYISPVRKSPFHDSSYNSINYFSVVVPIYKKDKGEKSLTYSAFVSVVINSNNFFF